MVLLFNWQVILSWNPSSSTEELDFRCSGEASKGGDGPPTNGFVVAAPNPPTRLRMFRSNFERKRTHSIVCSDSGRSGQGRRAKATGIYAHSHSDMDGQSSVNQSYCK